jgi:hypothetical protein
MTNSYPHERQPRQQAGDHKQGSGDQFCGNRTLRRDHLSMRLIMAVIDGPGADIGRCRHGWVFEMGVRVIGARRQTPGVASARADKGDDTCDNRADEWQKDDGLVHRLRFSNPSSG